MVSPEFEKYATEALGTDDPAKISALKEAIMACMGTDYEDEEADSETSGDMDLAAIFGPTKK